MDAEVKYPKDFQEFLKQFKDEGSCRKDLKKTAKDCGLKGIENINYLQAIKRIIGMSNKSL
ncbi:MAG: hypothetical protein LBH91_06530 [Prevotellaceae bacterium]|jgi:hypothetical protein|nr:hypothetical protein [Prevotellaceae bacterium]